MPRTGNPYGSWKNSPLGAEVLKGIRVESKTALSSSKNKALAYFLAAQPISLSEEIKMRNRVIGSIAGGALGFGLTSPISQSLGLTGSTASMFFTFVGVMLGIFASLLFDVFAGNVGKVSATSESKSSSRP
jgi:hypothetical protein